MVGKKVGSLPLSFERGDQGQGREQGSIEAIPHLDAHTHAAVIVIKQPSGQAECTVCFDRLRCLLGAWR